MHDCLLINGLQPMDWLDGQIFEKSMSEKLMRKKLWGKVCGYASLTGKGCEDTVSHVNADQIVSNRGILQSWRQDDPFCVHSVSFPHLPSHFPMGP